MLLSTSPHKIQTLLVKWFMVKKKLPNKWHLASLYTLCFFISRFIPVFRSALLRKSYIYLLLKPTKSKQIKNDNSCKVPISCTMYIIFISKVQQSNEKLTPIGYLISNCFWTRNKSGFLHACIISCLISIKTANYTCVVVTRPDVR